jgi:hypothetical protein
MRWRTALLVAACGLAAVSCAEQGLFGDLGAAREARAPDSRGGDLFIPPSVVIKGTVRAPEGKMPIAGALVYATAKPPPPIPDKVFCDRCVELTKGTPNATSAADGSFSIKLAAGKWLLVTQKGAFRRVREIEVPASGMTVPEPLTTLPARTDAAKGDTIPKMAVVIGGWDAIENSLAKLGLGQVDAKGKAVPGSESFTRYECKLTSIWPPASECKPVQPCELLRRADEISKHHIVFVPCASDWLNGCFASSEVQKNVMDYVKAGGRVYVTDYQYDLINVTFPGYISWEGASGTMDSAELTQPYDAPAIVNDPDLKAWLAAQNLVSFDLLESYTVISGLAKLPTPGPDAKPDKVYNLGPYAWISGNVPGRGVRPMTVTFPYGCGKVLFSTYHTEGDKGGLELLPQERALLYVVLEVAVCMKDPVVE